MAITKIQSESMNLADTYAFTGTVTGAGGITMVDLWRTTSDLSTSNTKTVVSSSWERADDASSGFIGTGMTESSGIFTFPQTGIYQVVFNAVFLKTGDSRYTNSKIDVTQDNSSYDEVGLSQSFIQQTNSGSTYSNPIAEAIVDVTDTSNVKVRVATQTEQSCTLNSASDRNNTHVTFIRLGDT